MKRYKFHSIPVKMAMLMIISGLVILLVTYALVPSVFYSLTKRDLHQNAAQTIEQSAIRLSYVLTQHNAARSVMESDSFKQLFHDYYNGISADTTKSEILNRLPINLYGVYQNDFGFNQNTMYILVATEHGDWFCQEEITPLSATLASTFGDGLLVPSTTAYYLPIFSATINGKETQFFSYVEPFLSENMQCWMITLTEFSTVEDQFSALSSLGINSYQLICGETVIYQHVATGDVPAFPAADQFSTLQFLINESETADGVDYLVLCSYIDEALYLCVHIPHESFLLPYRTFFTAIRVILLLSILLLIIISCIIVKGSLERLVRLNVAMQKIQDGYYEIKDTGSQDEIGNIIRTINQMLLQIHTDMEHKLEHEQNEKRMQYLLLVSAIDPHFIYNTLDIITFLAAMGRTDEIILVNKSLIGTLKDRLGIKSSKIFDSVAAEKAVVEQYMVIQRYLCANHIAFRFTVAPENLQLQIPKNIIQPLVENAIKHGILTHKDTDRLQVKDGRIDVSVVSHNDHICITVEDDGSGMSEELQKCYQQEEISLNANSEHIGLDNIRARLYYLYGKSFSFAIHSIPGNGTTITIKIPSSQPQLKNVV